MFKENRFLLRFGINLEARQSSTDDSNEAQTDAAETSESEPADPETTDIAEEFEALAQFDNQAAVSPIDQGVGFTRYEVTTPGTLESIQDLLETNFANLETDGSAYYRVYDASNQEVFAGSYPQEFNGILDQGFQVEVSSFVNEQGRDFMQLFQPRDFGRDQTIIDYTVRQNTTLTEIAQSGFTEMLSTNHDLIGRPGIRTRFEVADPEGRTIARGSLDQLTGELPARLAAAEIPAFSTFQTRVYGDFASPEATDAVAEAPEFNYTAEEFARWAEVVRGLNDAQKMLISRDFAENPDEYDDRQIVSLVGQYQARNGLEVDGKTGRYTLAQLNEQVAYFQSFQDAQEAMASLGQSLAGPEVAAESVSDRGALPFLTNPDGTPTESIFGAGPSRSGSEEAEPQPTVATALDGVDLAPPVLPERELGQQTTLAGDTFVPELPASQETASLDQDPDNPS